MVAAGSVVRAVAVVAPARTRTVGRPPARGAESRGKGPRGVGCALQHHRPVEQLEDRAHPGAAVVVVHGFAFGCDVKHTPYRALPALSRPAGLAFDFGGQSLHKGSRF